MQKENPETNYKWNKQQEKSLLISEMRACASLKTELSTEKSYNECKQTSKKNHPNHMRKTGCIMWLQVC